MSYIIAAVGWYLLFMISDSESDSDSEHYEPLGRLSYTWLFNWMVDWVIDWACVSLLSLHSLSGVSLISLLRPTRWIVSDQYMPSDVRYTDTHLSPLSCTAYHLSVSWNTVTSIRICSPFTLLGIGSHTYGILAQQTRCVVSWCRAIKVQQCWLIKLLLTVCPSQILEYHYLHLLGHWLTHKKRVWDQCYQNYQCHFHLYGVCDDSLA